MPNRSLLIVFCTTCLLAFQSGTSPKVAMTPEIRTMLDHVRAESMRGDLTFLASDLLEGRNSPSRGLDIASEYIAAQFLRTGIEPAGIDGYFQVAKLAFVEPNLDGFELNLSHSGQSVSVTGKDVSANSGAGLDFKNEPIFKLDPTDAALVEGLTPQQMTGKVVLLALRGNQASFRVVAEKMRQAKPLVSISVSRGTPRGPQRAQLTDPSEAAAGYPRITWYGDAANSFYDSLKPGDTGATATLHLAPPHLTPANPRNVMGVLRGSDPALKDTYILLTAHYDHLGMRPEGTTGDRIFNGANDDGSGTVSVIEVGRALASMKQRPRRSIVFMAFCCEEEGLVGSRYYAHHPVLPLAKIVGQINLEQLGRTDDSEGPQVGTATITGFDYSTLADSIRAAADATSVKVYKHPRNSDAYFFASDNGPLAETGVPAHTIGVTFEFPDYHKVGDEVQKIDFDNMAKIDRMVALSVLLAANNPEAPRWDESNPRTAPYVKALKQRH